MFERVELREGTSDKFWEVRVEGCEVATFWGRAGTRGQSKTKSHATPQAALAEARKQLEEKLRKGYRSVACEPSIELVEPTVEVLDLGPAEHDWQAALRHRHNPWRRDGLEPEPGRAVLPSENLALYRAGLGLTVPTLQTVTRQALRHLGGESAPLDRPTAALLLRLTSGGAADFLAQNLPPLELLEVMLAADRLHTTTRYAGGKAVAMWVLRRPAQSRHLFEPARPGPWQALRQALARCPQREYERALQRARELYAEADHERRCQLAFAFPDTGWADTEARYGWENQATLYGTVTAVPPCTYLTLASLMDVERVNQLLSHPYGAPDPGFGPMLLGNLGALAFPWLVKRQGWRDPLWEIPDAQLAQQLRALLDDRSERANLTTYYSRWPEHSIPVLAQVLATDGKGRDVARTLLTQILRQSPRLPALEPRAENVCRDLLGRLGSAGPAAADDELPPVLRRPPWLEKRKTAARTVSQVELPPTEERIEWDGAPPSGPLRHTPPAAGPLDDKLRQAFRRSVARGQVAIYELEQLSDPVALEMWNETPARSWYAWEMPLDNILARFGIAALPGVLAQAGADLAATAAALVRVDSPRVAPVMASAFAGQKARRSARTWMLRFPETAALGLTVLAVGELGPRRNAAEDACRWLAAEGHRDELRAAARTLRVEQALDELLARDPLLDVPAKPPKLPDFFDVALLPAPRLRSGKSLGAQAMTHLATMLAFSPLDPPYAGLEQVRAACEGLEDFAWELFSLWLTAGGPAREKWAFLALAHFGGDEAARRLAPMLKSWPAEGLSARAELGLDVLGAIGSDVALMQIHQMSQRLKSRPLQEKARLRLDEIALRRGLTPDELADRLVPDLDLETDGSCLVAGIRVVFDEQLKPSLVGHRDLPRSAGEDAVKRWKALKKDARAVAQSQILRLEIAMSSQRRWSIATWRLCLLEHPLLVHLTRRLVWGLYRDGVLTHTFRVAEDSTLANAQDEPFSLPQDGLIGLPHPLEMDELDAWGQVLGDYAILQPFPQLARAVFRLSPEEAAADRLGRIEGRKVAALKLLGLESRGWRRGPVEDGGTVLSMEKPLGGGLTACLELEPGFWVAAPAQAEPQMLSRLRISRAGAYEASPLSEAGPLAVSDLVADLEAL